MALILLIIHIYINPSKVEEGIHAVEIVCIINHEDFDAILHRLVSDVHSKGTSPSMCVQLLVSSASFHSCLWIIKSEGPDDELESLL